MANIFICDDRPELNFVRSFDGGTHGWETAYPDEWPVYRPPLTYGVNTTVAARENGAILRELANRHHTGCTIEAATDFVFDGLELPSKLVNEAGSSNAREPVPICIRGAVPSVKAINLNRDAPAAFWFDQDINNISLYRSLTPVQRLENLQISSHSKGGYFCGHCPSFHDVHYAACGDWGLHIDCCYKISLPPLTIARRCKNGIKFEHVGHAELGLLEAQECETGIHLLTTGVIGGSICGEHNRAWNHDINGCRIGSLRFSQEHGSGKSRVHNSAINLDLVYPQDPWQIEWDEYSKQHCTINGVPLMAQFKFNVGLIVRHGLSVTSPSPPEMTLGEPFSHQFIASGGNGAYVWSVTGGALPPGLGLAINGLLSGTPTQPGIFQAEITVSG